jgi:hypothetical protein
MPINVNQLCEDHNIANFDEVIEDFVLSTRLSYFNHPLEFIAWFNKKFGAVVQP